MGESETQQVARILIVDDRPANLLALEAVLAPLGHQLVRARSGEEALRRLLESDFSVILLDAQMPGIDGYQTASIIKSRRRTASVPIIFITAANRDAGQALRGYAHGAVDFLVKPIDPEILRSKVSVFVDLHLKTERIRQQEEQLRAHEREVLKQRSERRFRAFFDLMPVCVWHVSTEGTITYANRACIDYMGPDVENRPHEVSLAAAHPDDLAKHKPNEMFVLARGKPFEFEARLRRRSDGVWRWHLMRCVPETDESGAPLGWIVVASDIDDARRADEARSALLAQEHRAREEAEAANRAKDEFLAILSHELRTPLTSILGWIPLLRSKGGDQARLTRGLEVIERNAHAQRHLIEDLLDVSRIVAGKLQLDPAPFDLGNAIETSIDAHRPNAEARGVTLTARIEGDAREYCGDRERLQQVVENLLSNALKFTPRGGTIDVRLDAGPDELVIEVKDSGVGIEPEFLPWVFDRFKQADPSRTRRHGGLGLGLAIVRHIAELHGGRAEVTSEGPGQGATFRICLPRQGIVANERRHHPRAEGIGGERLLQGARILVVEDEVDTREVLGEMLRGHGADIRAVGTAAEALALLDLERFDVLVSDVGLPGDDGYELVRRVRQRPANRGGALPAVALTAFAGAEDARRALDAGFLVHLPKPWDPQILARTVGSLYLSGDRAAEVSARDEATIVDDPAEASVA